MLKLQRPAKTSRTLCKPPATDRKERREQSRAGGAKPGHEGHSRVIAENADQIVDQSPRACPDCGLALSAHLPAEPVSVHERIELPEAKPLVVQHRRLAVCARDAGLQGAWPAQVVSGFFNYHAVPTNARVLSAFRDRVVELWRRSLRRRSQRDFTTWERMRKLASDWLPRPRILHP